MGTGGECEQGYVSGWDGTGMIWTRADLFYISNAEHERSFLLLRVIQNQDTMSQTKSDSMCFRQFSSFSWLSFSHGTLWKQPLNYIPAGPGQRPALIVSFPSWTRGLRVPTAWAGPSERASTWGLIKGIVGKKGWRSHLGYIRDPPPLGPLPQNKTLSPNPGQNDL